MTRRVFLDVAITLAALAYALMALTPATFWIDPIEIHVRDSPYGEQPTTLVYVRRISRPFNGHYQVAVRSLADGRVACESSGNLPYRATEGKVVFRLDAWAPNDPRCQVLPPGDYMMDTCWTIVGPFAGLVPDKTKCVVSNKFQIVGTTPERAYPHPVPAPDQETP